MDELKNINPEILKRYGLGSYEDLQTKMDGIASLEQLML